MSKKRTYIQILILIVGILILGNNTAVANQNQDYISKIKEIKKQYSDIEFIDGIMLKQNEKINVNDYVKENVGQEVVEMNIFDNKIIKNKNEIIAQNKGTSFVIVKTENKTYAIEVAIIGENEFSNKERASEVERDYYKVFIDAGHGGEDPGAIANGVKEKDINLKIAKKLQKKLENKKIDVKVTRKNEETVSLYERAKMANEYGADVFISIHQNSFSTSKAHGIETYYHREKPKYKGYATKVQNNIIKKTGAYNRGVKTANFVVIRETTMPAILIEGGFITNKNEVAKLKTDSYQEKIAIGIEESVEQYLKDNIKLASYEKGVFKDTKGHWAKNPIKDFVIKGYVNGYPDGTFKPDQAITRAEFVKMINRVFNFVKSKDEFFIDVNKEEWFYEDVKKAVAQGYISNENKKFRPNDNITREEAAAMISNITKKRDENLNKIEKYKDKHRVSKWALSSVEGVIENGYMGRGSDMFRPKDKLTRAEAIALLISIK